MYTRLLFLLSLAFALYGAKAQNTETEYLFGNKSSYAVGGFGGPLLMITPFENTLALYSGGGGGLIVNGRFSLGGCGMGLATDHLVSQSLSGSKDYLSFGHGGLWVGYNTDPTK